MAQRYEFLHLDKSPLYAAYTDQVASDIQNDWPRISQGTTQCNEHFIFIVIQALENKDVVGPRDNGNAEPAVVDRNFAEETRSRPSGHDARPDPTAPLGGNQPRREAGQRQFDDPRWTTERGAVHILMASDTRRYRGSATLMTLLRRLSAIQPIGVAPRPARRAAASRVAGASRC